VHLLLEEPHPNQPASSTKTSAAEAVELESFEDWLCVEVLVSTLRSKQAQSAAWCWTASSLEGPPRAAFGWIQGAPASRQ